MNFIPVEYIENGTFVGGEEDCFNDDIKTGDTCYVITQEYKNKLDRFLDAIPMEL